jgi:hypothetical protein
MRLGFAMFTQAASKNLAPLLRPVNSPDTTQSTQIKRLAQIRQCVKIALLSQLRSTHHWKQCQLSGSPCWALLCVSAGFRGLGSAQNYHPTNLLLALPARWPASIDAHLPLKNITSRIGRDVLLRTGPVRPRRPPM